MRDGAARAGSPSAPAIAPHHTPHSPQQAEQTPPVRPTQFCSPPSQGMLQVLPLRQEWGAHKQELSSPSPGVGAAPGQAWGL